MLKKFFHSGAYSVERPTGIVLGEDGSKRFFWVPFNKRSHYNVGTQVSFIPAIDERGKLATAVEINDDEVKLLIPGLSLRRRRQIIQGTDPTAKKRVLDTLSEIATWKNESKNEDLDRYFWRYLEVEKLESGQCSFVIGRKGTGKSAIASHLLSRDHHSRTSRAIDLKKLPINELYQEADRAYPRSNQYVNLWKFVIYAIIIQMQVERETCNPGLRKKVEAMFPDLAEKQLSAQIFKKLGGTIKLSVFGVSFEAGNSNMVVRNPLPLGERVERMERLVLEHLDDSKFYVLLDELQEGYSALPKSDSDYWPLLAGLFKAINETRRILHSAGKKVFPIAFLRDDIFNEIYDSDKNKWLDYTVRLEWHTENLRNLCGYRIWRAMDRESESISLADAWTFISRIPFTEFLGSVDPFKYLLLFTHNRPRDIIKVFQLCADRALREAPNSITMATIRGIEHSYSDYFLNEIIDEAHIALPEISKILHLFQVVGKQNIKPDEFYKAYRQRFGDGSGVLAPEIVIRMLFDFSIIGQYSDDMNRDLFKYKNPNQSFQERRTCLLHRGLFKAIGV